METDDLLTALAVQHGLAHVDYGCLPPQMSLEGNVLDIQSGVGVWILHMAELYPSLHLTGVETRPGLVQYARAHCWAKQSMNTSFLEVEVENIRAPLSLFQEGSFCFVHATFQMGELHWCEWQNFVHQITALVKLGGFFQFMEVDDWQISGTAPALEELLTAIRQLLWLSGRCTSKKGSLGIAAYIHEIVCRNLEGTTLTYEECWLDEKQLQSLLVVLASLRHVLSNIGMTESMFHSLYQKVLQEVRLPSFRLCWRYGCVTGKGANRETEASRQVTPSLKWENIW